jgi:HK97 family phage major capsid protein
MSFPKLKETQERLNAKRDELKAVFDAAGPDRDMDKVTSLTGDSHAKVEWIRAKNTEIDELKAEFEKLRDLERAAKAAGEEREAIEAGSEPGEPGALQGAVKSLGQLFVESDAYKGYRAGQGTGPVAALKVPNIKNTLFETTAGWAPESTRTGIVSLFPTRPAPHVVDFIPTLPTRQSSVKFMEETTFTNNAAETAEGGLYGEGALVLTERSKPVETVKAFLPVTDQQLEDEEEAAAYVDQRLGFMVRQRLDSQVLVGSGVTPFIEGTENVTGIQVQALGADSIPDAIYKAIVLVNDDGFADPSAVFIRAAKWQSVVLAQTADGIYIWGHPSQAGPMTIWGVPVVKTNAVTATKAVLGDYLNHSTLYVRRGVDVQVSNSHDDFFIKGKQAIRADLRVAMAHYRPKAFAEVTGL